MSISAGWNRGFAGDDPTTAADVVVYGPEIGTEADFRLLGNVADKRVLELGCGSGSSSVAFAKQGARTIALDFAPDQLAATRRLSEREGVRLELHEGDLADLAFVRADSVDLVFSAYALQFVDDINRVFRQAHRVLKQGCPMVFSVPHPAYSMVDPDHPEQPLLIRHSYFDNARVDLGGDSPPFFAYRRGVADLFTGLTRNNFRVDTVIEPEPGDGGRRSGHWRDTLSYVPATLIIRARKEGV